MTHDSMTADAFREDSTTSHTDLLTARDVSLRLGTTQALDGASFAIQPGEIVSVMGPSGSGKSTLLHCSAGILRPDAGEVWFDGSRLDTLSESKRSAIRLREMGFVFQFGDLVPELSLLENVALPLQLPGVKRADARAHEVMGELGIDDVADGSVVTVSGGQAQRAAVARAIVHRPKVVFADEPTGSLDSVAGEQVMEALVDVAEKHGAAVVLVTHDARVAAYAHRNVTVRDGRTTAAAGAR